MAPKILFQRLLSILFYMGLQFEYKNSWKGKLAKTWFSFQLFTNVFILSTYFHFMVSQDQLEQFVASVSPMISTLFGCAKFLNFYLERTKYQELTVKLRSMANEGKVFRRFFLDPNIQPVLGPHFELFAKSNDKTNKRNIAYLLFSVGLVFFFFLQSIQQMFATGEKTFVLPMSYVDRIWKLSLIP